jgi:5-methylcytosine-specific restriction enzyme A
MKLHALKLQRGSSLPERVPRLGNPDATPRLYGRAAVDRRARWFALNPLCVRCQAAGITIPVPMATDLDHIVPLELGGSDTDDNLQGLCRAHHLDKTKLEAIQRARRRYGAP